MAPLNKLETVVVAIIMSAFCVLFYSCFLFFISAILSTQEVGPQFPLNPTAIYNHSDSSS